MKTKTKYYLVIAGAVCFTATLFLDNEPFYMMSVALYLVLLAVVYHLKIFKNPRLCLLAELIISSAVSVLLYQFSETFGTSVYIMVICFALSLSLVLEAGEAKEGWKRILCYILIAAFLLYVLNRSMFKAESRIRRENFNAQKSLINETGD